MKRSPKLSCDVRIHCWCTTHNGKNVRWLIHSRCCLWESAAAAAACHWLTSVSTSWYIAPRDHYSTHTHTVTSPHCRAGDVEDQDKVGVHYTSSHLVWVLWKRKVWALSVILWSCRGVGAVVIQNRYSRSTKYPILAAISGRCQVWGLRICNTWQLIINIIIIPHSTQSPRVPVYQSYILYKGSLFMSLYDL